MSQEDFNKGKKFGKALKKIIFSLTCGCSVGFVALSLLDSYGSFSESIRLVVSALITMQFTNYVLKLHERN